MWAHSLGLCVVPPREDGSKAPDGNWLHYQRERPSVEQLQRWYEQPRHGIGLVCGEVSGNLEGVDFDDANVYRAFIDLAIAAGLGELVVRIEAGYLERTPTDTIHWLWYCPEIGPNKKLAYRLVTAEDGSQRYKTTIETRGEGGFLVTAPSYGPVHPTGRPYERLRGDFDSIVSITPEERQALLTLASSLDERELPIRPVPARASHAAERVGDTFNQTADWPSILEPHAWTLVCTRGEVSHWRRPGKSYGTSATTNYRGLDLLYVFTKHTEEFEGGHAYQKFTAYTFLNHGGDFKAAAKELGRKMGIQPRRIPLKHSESDELLDIALAKYDPGMSDQNEPFLLPRSGPRLARPLRDQADIVMSELAAEYFAASGSPARVGSLKDALRVLQGRALQSPPVRLHLRVAETAGEVWLDLGRHSGECVRIGSKGWQIEHEASAFFKRTLLTGPQPLPTQGTLEELRPFLNVDEEGWSLICGWLAGALLPSIHQPVLLITGEQGTAKTTCASILTDLVDPSPARTRTAPHTIKDWAATGAASYVITLDNLSGIEGWLSDAICRAVTGDSFASRLLHTNGAVHLLSLHSAVILNGIDLGRLRPDLLDRAVPLELKPIPADARRQEDEIRAAFREAQPRILGGLLDCVSAVLRNRDRVQMKGYPRMAGYAKVLAALDLEYPWRTLDTYVAATSRALSSSVECDPVGAGVLVLMENRMHWEGSASALLDELRLLVPREQLPVNPRVLSSQFTRLAPTLRRAGIEVERAGNGHGRLIRLTNSKAAEDVIPKLGSTSEHPPYEASLN